MISCLHHKISVLAICLLAICCNEAFSQDCGTEYVHQQMMNNNPAYAKAIAAMDSEWAKMAEGKAQAKTIITGTDTIHEIPVVIHVLHRGESIGTSFNPADTQLLNLLDYVNKAYAGTWPGYAAVGSGGVKVPIRFVLAKVDPNCKPTTGINRVDARHIPKYEQYGISPDHGFGNGASFPELIRYVRWNTDEYYNIYLVHTIEDLGRSVTGFAFYPNGNFEGAVMEIAVAKQGEMILVHELGHSLYLKHTFEGDDGGTICPLNVNCGIDGDGICDTEPHKRTFVSCANDINPCTSKPINYTGLNFMSYSRICYDRFTAGQKNKMVYTLLNDGWRSILLKSVVPDAFNITQVQCTPDSNTYDNSNSNATGTGQFELGNIKHYSTPNHLFKNYYYDYTCRAKTILYTGRYYPLSVAYSGQQQYLKIYIDYNDDGNFTASELVSQGITINGINNNKYTDTIFIPSAGVTTCKYLRVRVVSEKVSAPAPGPCSDIIKGQVKEYAVYLSPPPLPHITIAQTSGLNPTCPDSLVAYTATVIGAPPVYTISWLANNIVYNTGNTFNYKNHYNASVVKAILLVKNHICDNTDTLYSNNDTVWHIPPGPVPNITRHGHGDTIVSDIYPVHWFHSTKGLMVANATTGYVPVFGGYHYAMNVSTGCPSAPSNTVYGAPVSNTNIFSQQGINVFPNPADATCTIKSQNIRFEKISVFDCFGQLVYTHAGVRDMLNLDVSSWNRGLYFISVEYVGGSREVLKLVVTQ